VTGEEEDGVETAVCTGDVCAGEEKEVDGGEHDEESEEGSEDGGERMYDPAGEPGEEASKPGCFSRRCCIFFSIFFRGPAGVSPGRTKRDQLSHCNRSVFC
jgi:hypothetical protein